jgi:hypothetical protein
MITVPDKETLRGMLATAQPGNCHWAIKFLPGQILEQRMAGETLEIQGLALGLLIAMRRAYEDAAVPGASINMMDTYAMLQSLPVFIKTFVPDEEVQKDIYQSMVDQAPAIFIIGPSSLRTKTNENTFSELLRSGYPERRELNDRLVEEILPQEKLTEWRSRGIDVSHWMVSSRKQIHVYVTVKVNDAETSITLTYKRDVRKIEVYRKGSEATSHTLPGSMTGICQRLGELIEYVEKTPAQT